MLYTLMHKNIPVLDILIDDVGQITEIKKIHDERHIPIGVNIENTTVNHLDLVNWWKSRGIPANRDELISFFEGYHTISPEILQKISFGLSLTDQYWINPILHNFKWEDVNFFDNPFSHDVGDMLFDKKEINVHDADFVSPDTSLNGYLKKRWIAKDDKRVLMKAGSRPYFQEPFNEQICSTILKKLNINHVSYNLNIINDKPYSLCETFINHDTEFIPASHILNSLKKADVDTRYEHFVRCCEKIGIESFIGSLDKMITFDFIVVNEDRHFGNFGFIRDANTLEWISFCPLFDNGCSFWYNTPGSKIGIYAESKGFEYNHGKKIQLVSNFDWLDINKLKDMDEIILEVFSISNIIDEKRSLRIAEKIKSRQFILEHLIDN